MPKILVIEDETNIQKLVKANLTASGYQVLVAANGEKMPGMSGWDVLMVLKANQRLRRIPVIIMTATVPDSEEYKIRGMRATGYLVKPFSADELLRQVKQVLGE